MSGIDDVDRKTEMVYYFFITRCKLYLDADIPSKGLQLEILNMISVGKSVLLSYARSGGKAIDGHQLL